jgi:hypothetical protein
MPFQLEYPIPVKPSVRRSIPAAPVLLGILLFPVLFVSLSPAQHESASAASSSSSHSSGGSAPSVSSVGHNGYAGTNCCISSSAPHSNHGSSASNGSNRHSHRHHTGQGDSYYGFIYEVPYAVDANSTDTDTDADDDDEYQGGPTIFDRRGSGADSYVPPTYEGPAHAPQYDAVQSENPPEPPQPPTTLVFKDGHQLEIENYAIVSQTLYDLTPGHPRKIALTDLDLPSTQKQNDDHGVTFDLPPSAQAN